MRIPPSVRDAFFGRAFVEEAARRGHEVTVFHRGESEPDGFPSVEHVHGDRKQGLDGLTGGSWDAVLDTWAFVPREVEELADAIGDRIGLSTRWCRRSVHRRICRSARTSARPSFTPYPDTEEVTEETYGPLKVASEEEAARRFDGRLLVIRPGYIVGPHDPTDRFTYWVRRARGRRRDARRGPPDAPSRGSTPGTSARSRSIGSRPGTGTRTASSVPPSPSRWPRSWTRRAAGDADTTFTWADEEWIRSLGDEHERWFPIWHPHLPGFHAYDAAKATAADLRPRPFDETIADTAWDRERGVPPLQAGMTPEKERELLDEWRAGRRRAFRGLTAHWRSRGTRRSQRRSAIGSSPS